MQKLYSDHNPIVLDTGTRDFGPVPFKFYNSWLLSDSLRLVVEHSWRVDEHNQENLTDIQILGKKLKRTKEAIKTWSKSESKARDRHMAGLKGGGEGSIYGGET